MALDDVPQWLYRCGDHSPFAYAHGHDLIRFADHTPWAHLSGDMLLSARSGMCLAYRRGTTFYDVDSNDALYYEPATCEPAWRARWWQRAS